MPENSKIAKNKWKMINLFFILLLLVGFILAFYNNWDELLKYKTIILNIRITNIFIILVLTMSATIFRSWRWYVLLLPLKNTITWKNILRITINALAANYSTPGKLGIPAKAVLLKRSEDVDVGKSLPSILGELFIEHSAEISLALVCILIGGHFKKLFLAIEKIISTSSVMQNILIFAGVIILSAIAGIVFKKKLKTLNFFNKLIEATKLTGKRYDYIAYSYLITLLNLIISYWVFWFLIATLGHPEIEFTFVVFAGTITNLLGLLSPLPGGIGVRELTIFGLYDVYFGLGGIAFLAIIIMRIITYFSLFLLFLMERLFASMLTSKKLINNPVI